MRHWDVVAQKLQSNPDFQFNKVTGKSAQARMNVLLKRHKASYAESARASDVAEEETELTILLDDLLALKTDFKETENKRK